MINLQGHRALVTGGTQGVGAAIAYSLAQAGADVVLHGLTIDEQAHATAAACRETGVEVGLIDGDLSGPTESAVQRVFEQAQTTLPGIDILINNAGTYADLPFLDMTYQSFERTMRLNVFSYFFLSQAFSRQWVNDNTAGRILLIGSINGRLAEPTHSGYDTSKGAIEMMVKTLCVELAPHQIRVNGLAPGLFRTPLTSSALDQPGVLQWMQQHTPNGQVPGPEVAGAAAAFLVSDVADHIHGQMLLIDGGMSVWQQPDL
ncbi:MAG: SDR family oxidoreductase [Pirellulaceae bacterium]|nr:SDR family oxidoreductase [Pirellulaceae bacterium]